MSRRQNLARLPRPGTASSGEVGYCRPPRHTRFQPGRSGNPRGRPKGSRNRLPGLHEERLKRIIIEEAYRPITVSDAKGPVTMPVAQAFMRSLGVSALKGHARAQRLFAELLSVTERSNCELYDRYLKRAIDYKADADEELERRRRAGLDSYDIIPHPDDIVIDPSTGTVEIRGPLTPEQKAAWDELARRRDQAQSYIAQFEAELETETDEAERADILAGIGQFRKAVATIDGAIGTWPVRAQRKSSA